MIDVRDLTFTYASGAEPAVRSARFQVEKGEIFGFLGPSGAGKSTTQKVLVGLLREYEGSVSVLGRDLRDWGPEYYERVGVSFEHPNHHLKLTARENLAYFASLYAGATEPVEDLLARVGLADAADTRVAQFSKGMRVRLTVVRALLNRPDVLFLDEPTAGLDPVNVTGIRDLILERRASGSTVFLTTHDMWTADQLCDRVAFIVDGRIRLIDSPRELRLRHGRPVVRVEYEAGGDDPGSGTEGARGGATTRHRDFELEGLGDDPEFLATLRQKRVRTIHTLEATLESVFIAVTGRSLTGGGG